MPVPLPPQIIDPPYGTFVASSTTPTFTFTCVDPDSDDLTYEIQIDTDPTFDSTTTTVAVDSYSESNQDDYEQIYNGTYTRRGQSFRGVTGTLEQAKFYLQKVGSPTGNITAVLYTHVGNFGTSSQGALSVLATSDTVDVTTLSTSFSLVTFTFSGANRITMDNLNYVILVEYTSGGASDYVNVGEDTSSSTHPGNAVYWYPPTPTWGSQGLDIIFYVYESYDVPLIDKVSSSDAGFANVSNGGDTSPFTSGDTISYTVQAGDALSIGVTYYWRVRAKDTGSNAYGPWNNPAVFGAWIKS